MSAPIDFDKEIGTDHFRIHLKAYRDAGGELVVSALRGRGQFEHRDSIAIREEAIKDLHYALGQYIELREKQQ